jgi:hypothetical protein
MPETDGLVTLFVSDDEFEQVISSKTGSSLKALRDKGLEVISLPDQPKPDPASCSLG